MRRIRALELLLPLAGALLFLLFPARAAAGAVSGLRLAAELLIPSLFPLGALSGCLLRMGPESAAEHLAGRAVRAVLGLPGAGAVPLLLGLLGGYPLGAQLTASMYREGRLSRSDALRLSALCNNAGPAFLLGVAGGVLGDRRLGAALLGIQLLSVLGVGLLLWRPGSGAAPAPVPGGEALRFPDALLRSIRESAAAMLTLAGTVSFFHAALACLEALLPLSGLPPLPRAALTGFLELSEGMEELRGLPREAALPLAALLIGWGGCCVHLQAASALRAAGLPVGPYLRGKLLQGALCLLLAAALQAALDLHVTPAAVLAGCQLLLLFFFAIFKKSRWKSSGSVL